MHVYIEYIDIVWLCIMYIYLSVYIFSCGYRFAFGLVLAACGYCCYRYRYCYCYCWITLLLSIIGLAICLACYRFVGDDNLATLTHLLQVSLCDWGEFSFCLFSVVLFAFLFAVCFFALLFFQLCFPVLLFTVTVIWGYIAQQQISFVFLFFLLFYAFTVRLLSLSL